MAFEKTVLTNDQERDQILRPKIAALESDRIQQALEGDALRALGDLNDAEQGELAALDRAVERLDARIAVHCARLEQLSK